MTERFGPALQAANIRKLSPHDEFDHRFDNLMPRSTTLSERLHCNGAERHLPDADEPVNMVGEEYQNSIDLIANDDSRGFASFFGGSDCSGDESEEDSEIDEIMRQDLESDWLDLPLEDLDFDPYPDQNGPALDPAFDAALVAYVGGIRGRGTMTDKYRSFDETQCVPLCSDRRYTDSHGDRGRKPHRPMHVSVRRMMPTDEF